MPRNWIPLTSAALLIAIPLAAQQDSDRVRVEARRVPSGEVWQAVMRPRARLGVMVNLQAQATDSVGAYVQSVTPGGPADKAGLRSGDVITRLDGKSLLQGGSGQQPDANDRSLPGLRLVELAAKLAPDDTISVEYRRDGQRKTATLATEAEPAWKVSVLPREPLSIYQFRQPSGNLPPEMFNQMTQSMPRMAYFLDAPLSRVELAPLNPDLGQYFGTTDGVLVIRVPKDSKLGVKGGDVILSVDGRKPESPAHLLRILRSYNSGEQFKLEIMRNHHRQTVSGQLDQPGSSADDTSLLPTRIDDMGE